MSDAARLRALPAALRLPVLLNDSVLYGGASVASKVFSVLAVPVLTRALASDAFGAMDAIAALGAVFVALATMGQDAAATRFYYEAEEASERAAIVTQGLVIQLVLALAVTATVSLTASWWLTDVLSAPDHVRAFRLLVAAMPFVVVFQFCQGLLRWTFARWPCVLLSVGATALLMTSTVGLVLLGFGVEGVFLAYLMSNTVSALASVWLCRHLFTLRLDSSRLRPMLRYGWPYMTMAVLSVALPALDRVFVTQRLGLQPMGHYAVGAKVAMMLSLPIAAFHSAWGPFSLAIYKERDATATYERVLSLYVFGLSLVLVAMSFAAEPLVWLAASSRYTGAAAVIVPLGCGVVIEAVSWITGIGIDLSKRTHYAALAYVTGLGVTLAALSALVGPFGLIGVAYGTLIGRVAQAAAYTWGGYRAYPLRFSLAGPTTMLAGALLVAVAGTALPLDDGAAMGGARLVLFLLFFSAAWRLSLSADDRAIVVATVRAAVGWTRARTDPTHGPAPPASPVTRAESASPGVRR